MNHTRNALLSDSLQKDFDPQQLVQSAIDLGEEWADNNAAAEALEESKKSVLARYVIEYMEKGLQSAAPGERAKPMSAAAAEQRALAHPGFEMHLELMVNARKDANKSRVRYDMQKMTLELFRSKQATLRSEHRLGGMNT
jgi:hypothetical protein